MRKLLLILTGPVLMSVVGVVVALVIGEFAVRAYQHEPLLPLLPPEPYVDNAILYRPNATRLYDLRPGVDAVVGRNRVHIHINAAGLRDDRELPTAKPEGVYRIVVLGDSFTFGGKVAVEDTFPRSLERSLQSLDPSRRYEALNLAVPGYNTQQEMWSLKESGLAYHPDLVIANFVLNDAGRAQQLVPHASRFPVWLRRILKRSDLVRFVYASVKQMKFLMRGGAFREAEKYSEFADGNPGWDASRAALAEIQRLASAGHAELLVVIWPMLVDLRGDYPHRDKHHVVAAECRRLGISVLDLLPTFEGHEASVLWASRNDHHPNKTALQMGADAVLRDLAAERMLPSVVAQR